jgi:NAD(P)-dependent dehydrogenase (short-subunit alcohol dehydrogenase family)
MRILEGKSAIITGASSGIGRASALSFSDSGASIVLVARHLDKLEGVVAEIIQRGGNAVAIAGDVAEEQTHSRAVDAALNAFGRLDIAFNNAGDVGSMKPLAELEFAEWQQVISVNLSAAFLGAKAQINAMLGTGGGSIIFTGSFVGSSVGLPGMSAYGTAKSGLIGLAKGIAADYGASGIRANVLQSGGTRTAMAGSPEQQEWAAGLHAMKRIAEPEEIAHAALFLASDMASFVTGSALWADGGNSAVK